MITLLALLAAAVILGLGIRIGIHLATIAIHHHAAENLEPHEIPEFRRMMDKTLENDR